MPVRSVVHRRLPHRWLASGSGRPSLSGGRAGPSWGRVLAMGAMLGLAGTAALADSPAVPQTQGPTAAPIAATAAAPASADTATMVDMAGRQVAVPKAVERPFGAAPPITALLFALAPERVIALNMPFAPDSAGLVPPATAGLPVLGSAMGHGRQVDPEALLKVRPDLAIAWQNAFSDLDPDGIAAPFRKIGVPVFFVKLDTLDDWPAAFETVGELLGREARAKALADYIREALARVRAAVAAIPESERLPVYYAEGPDGLATDCDRSFHTEAIALAGGANVYRCATQDDGGDGAGEPGADPALEAGGPGGPGPRLPAGLERGRPLGGGARGRGWTGACDPVPSR